MGLLTGWKSKHKGLLTLMQTFSARLSSRFRNWDSQGKLSSHSQSRLSILFWELSFSSSTLILILGDLIGKFSNIPLQSLCFNSIVKIPIWVYNKNAHSVLIWPSFSKIQETHYLSQLYSFPSELSFSTLNFSPRTLILDSQKFPWEDSFSNSILST